MVKRPSFFYGWVIVVIGFIATVFIYGTRHSFSVFFPSILDEFGWSRGSTALMLSFNLMVYGFVAPFAGSLGDRWNARRVVLIGVVILAVSIAGCALATELWHFYALFGVLVPIGTSLSGWPLLGPTLARWFVKHRGFAMGAGQAGSGISFVFGLFVSSIIVQVGWRQAYVAVAIVLAVVMIPLFLLFFRARPEDKGLAPYGAAEVSTTTNCSVQSVPGNADWTVRRAMKTYQLWLMLLNQSMFWGIGLYLVLGHQVKFAEDVGFSPAFAASIFALFGLAMTVGEFGGFIGDRFGRERGNTLASLAPIIAVGALLLVKDTSQPWLFYLYALFSGFGGGLYLSTYYAGLADIFHGKHFGAILGLSLAGFGVGGVIGPWLGGYIYDKTGSYTWAFILSLMSFVIACVVFWLAAPRHAARLRARAFGSIDNKLAV